LALAGLMAGAAAVHGQDLEAPVCGSNTNVALGDPAATISDIDRLRQSHVKQIDESNPCTPITDFCRTDASDTKSHYSWTFNQAGQLVREVGVPMEFGQEHSVWTYIYQGGGRYPVASSMDGAPPVPTLRGNADTAGPVTIITYGPNEKGIVQRVYRAGYLSDEVVKVGGAMQRTDCVYERVGPSNNFTRITQDVTQGDDRSKQYVESVRTFNDKALLIAEMNLGEPGGVLPNTEISYTYTAFDSKGNWTARKECWHESGGTGTNHNWCTTRTRAITYW